MDETSTEISPFQIDGETDSEDKATVEFSKQEGEQSEPFDEGEPLESIEEVDSEVLQDFLDKFQTAKAYRAKYYDEIWNLADEAYYGIVSELNTANAEQDFRSNIRMREAYIQVESMSAKVIPSLLGNSPPISVMPIDWTDDREQTAIAIEQHLYYTFMHKMNPIETLTRWVKAGSKYGLGVFRAYWQFDTGYRTRREPIYDDKTGKMIGFKKIRSKGIRKDRAQIEHIDTRSFWWNPDAKDRVRWCIYEYFRPLSEIQRLGEAGIYRNTEDLTDFAGGKSNEDSEEIRTQSGDKTTENNSTEPMVKIHELWSETCMTVIANESAVLSYRPNPNDTGAITFYFYRASVTDSDFVGIGEIEPVLDLEEGENAIRNMRLDNLNRIIHRQILVSNTAGLKGKKFRFTPLGIHRVADINGVKAFDMPDVTQSAYLEEQKYESQIDKTNGNPEVGRGERGPSRESATGVAVRSNSANLRTDLKVQFAQREVARCLEDVYGMECQYADRNRMIEVQGMNGSRLFRRAHELYDLPCEFMYRVGGYVGNKIIDRQQFLQTLQAMAIFPGVPQQFDPREIAKMMADLYSGPIDARRLLVKPVSVGEGYTRDPFAENRRMLLGEDDIIVMAGEPHSVHITVHLVLVDSPDVPKDVKKAARRHIQWHQAFLQNDFKLMGEMGGAISNQNRAMGMPQGMNPVNPGMLPTPEMDMAQEMATGQGGMTLAAAPGMAPGNSMG